MSDRSGFAGPLLSFFGGHVNEATWAFSQDYFFWITLGFPFYAFGQALNPMIRADGSPRFAMGAMMGGALLNCVLDPLFLYTFKMGMGGAAIATILGQIVTALLSLWYLFHLHAVTLHRRDFLLRAKECWRIVSLGMCSFLAQISLVAAMAAINMMIVKTSALDPIFSDPQYAQIPMAVVGIVMKFFQIVISVAIGLSAGSIPIVSFNMGAGLYGRVSSLFKMILGAEFVTGLLALFCAQVLPQPMISLFGAGSESVYYTQFAIKAFRTYLCLVPLAAINKGVFFFLQAMGKAGQSTFLSMIRELVFGVGFAILLGNWFGLDGVLYSMPVSDAITFIVSLVLIIHTFRTLHRDMRKQQIPDAKPALAK